MRNAKQELLPEILVERALLKELNPEEQMRLERVMAENPEERQRFEELKKRNQDFFEAYPAESFLNRLKEEEARERILETAQKSQESANRKILVLGPVFLAAAMALILFWPQGRQPEPVFQGTEITRIKGMVPHLMVYRKAGSRVEVLNPESRVFEGDLLQIAYHAAGYAHGVLFSIDGAGNMTRHFPEPGKTSQLDENKKEVLLPFAYQLDNAPGFERFFWVVSQKPLDAGEILKKAGQALKDKDPLKSPLELEEGQIQTSFLLMKGE